jgi:hypothetical protein
MWQTPVSKMSPMNVTPRSSSIPRAASTSSTCSARWFVFGVKSPMPIFSGFTTLSVTVPVSNSAKFRSGLYIERVSPSVVP